jgi:hypothetical protein
MQAKSFHDYIIAVVTKSGGIGTIISIIVIAVVITISIPEASTAAAHGAEQIGDAEFHTKATAKSGSISISSLSGLIPGSSILKFLNQLLVIHIFGFK